MAQQINTILLLLILIGIVGALLVMFFTLEKEMVMRADGCRFELLVRLSRKRVAALQLVQLVVLARSLQQAMSL
jgi:hypothetical protein